MTPKKNKESTRQVRPTSNGFGSVGPIQIFRAILAGINEAGIATVLLIIFLLMYMGILPSGVSQAFDRLSQDHTKIINVSTETATAVQKALIEHQAIQMRLLRQICRNTSKTETHTIECDR